MAKQQQKPVSKKVAPKPTVNKNMVSVGRLKTVRDSLKKDNLMNTSTSLDIASGKSGLSKKASDSLLNSLGKKWERQTKSIMKYDGIIKKATTKKK
jgi:hypothetical protein